MPRAATAIAVALVAGVVAGLIPTEASAGVVRTEPASDGSGQVLRFDAHPGESNRLAIELDEVAASYTLTESGWDARDLPATLTAGAGCVQVTAQQVRCAVVASRFRSIVELGDRIDHVRAEGIGDDDLRGGDADDSLFGGGGSDTLVGGPGADGLEGEAGDDKLPADPGNDSLVGGSGVDLADYSARTTAQRIVLDIDDSGMNGDVASGEDDNFYSDIEHARGGSGNDDITTARELSSVLEGGAGNDRLTGGRGFDALAGGTGDDRLIDGGYASVASHDVFDGGAGSDDVSYSSRSDRVRIDISEGIGGAPGEDDRIVGVENAEGGAAGDVLLGDGGPNRLDGRGSTNALWDVVEGRGGDDRLEGGILRGGPGNDVLGVPGGPVNVVDYSDSPAPVAVDLTDALPDGATASGELDHVDPGVAKLVGSRFDDQLRGSARTDDVLGGMGDDELRAVDRAAFHQELYGDGGDDRLYASPGGATLDGGDGADRLLGPGGQRGGPGPDVLRGSDGDDGLDGGFGDDMLTGLGGGDALTGGPGSDTVDYSERARRVEAYLNESWRFSGDREAGEMDELSEVENFLGGAGADLVHGSEQRNRIHGGGGGDVIHGARGADILAGDAGADELHGDDGADSVQGGTDDDRLDGGGRAGVDELDGGEGADTAVYSGRTERVHVDLASPDADGEEGEVDLLGAIENVVGGAGDDVIRGDDSPNRLEGGAGNDDLTGNLGADDLFGDAGDDSLFSADGVRDRGSCGAGSDRAVADEADAIEPDCETVEGSAAAQSARAAAGSADALGGDTAPERALSAQAAAWSPAPGPPAELDPGTQRRISRMGPDGNPAFNAFGPSIAYDTQNDRYLVLWYGKDRADDGYEIWGRLLDGDGAPAGDQFKVSRTLPDNPDVWAQSPAAAYNERTGEFLVVWNGAGQIRAQRLGGDGSDRGADDFAVSRGGGSLPAVGVDSTSGQYLVVWSSPSSLADPGDRREIHGQRLDPAGEELGEDDFQISEDEAGRGVGSDALSPAVAFNAAAREFLVAWIGNTSWSTTRSSAVVYGQRLTRLGGEVGPEDIQLSAAGTSPAGLELEHNPRSGEYLVVWSGEHGGDAMRRRDVMAQRISSQGEEVGPDDQLVSRTEWEDGGRGQGAVSVGLALNPRSGDYLVTWAAADYPSPEVDGKDTIYGQRLSAEGREFGRDDFQISAMGAPADPRYDSGSPEAAYGGRAHGFLVAWTGDHDGDGGVDNDFETFGRRLTHFAGDPPEGDSATDRDPPDTTIVRAPPEHSAQSSASFELRSSEQGSSFECRRSKADWQPCDSAVSLGDLPDGWHRFEARAVDPAGNTEGDPAAHVWRVDTTAPDVRYLEGPDGRTTSAEARFRFGAVWDEGDPHGLIYECRLDGADWERCGQASASEPSKHYSGLSEGPHRFEVRATDRVGNVEPVPASRSWTVEGPSVAIVTGPHEATPSREAVFHFRGTRPDDRFECSLDAGEMRPCSSPVTYAGLSEGAHTLTVRDADGVLHSAERRWVVDDRPPETTITEQVAWRQGTQASFRVEPSERADIECRLDGAPWKHCNVVVDYRDLPDGVHTFEARATDAAGNRDASPAVGRFRTDTRPPDTTLRSGPSGTTAEDDATFEFSADEESELECQLDGDYWDRCESPTTYRDLPDGQHTFRVRAVDAAENYERVPAARTWRIDTHAPSTRIYGGPPPRTAERSASFELDASEPAGFECRLDNAEWRACEREVRYGGLSDGEHRFEARAIDAAGERDLSPAYRVWRIGAPPPEPETSIESGPPRVTRDDSARFRLASSVAGSSFECRVDGGTWFGCPADLELRALADGAHELVVRAVSERTDQTPATYGWRVDTAAPDTVIDAAPAASSASDEAVFRFSASEPVAVFACQLDGGAWQPCSSPWRRTGLAPGDHTFEVRASDEAGNTDPSAARRDWTISAGQQLHTTAPSPFGARDALRSSARAGRERLMRLGARRLLRGGGATLRLTAPEPGGYRLALAHEPSARIADSTRPRLVARGSIRLTEPGAKNARLRLTRAGRRLLTGRSRVKLVLRVTFRPDSGGELTERVAVPLAARPRVSSTRSRAG